MNEDLQALELFSGHVRLFPLPNLVLFPNVVQPLHIFEPRYRQLMSDCLDTDRLMGIALLMPGWDEDDTPRPNLYPIACLGRVVADHKLPDGQYNMLLRGLGRIRLTEELVVNSPYRCCRAEIMPEVPVADLATAVGLRRELSRAVLSKFSQSQHNRKQLLELFDSELSLGDLCDILAFALPLCVEQKQDMLEAVQVLDRVRLLKHSLDAYEPTPTAPPERKFPPGFSLN